MSNPNDKAVTYNIYGRAKESAQTNAEVVLSPLTAEVLRDIARNESCSKSWRKAALSFLIKRKHGYQMLPEFLILRQEILDEQTAESEVQDAVESAIEESF